MYRSFTARALAVCLALAVASCGASRDEVMRRHVARGDEYLAKKQFQEAIVEYRNAVKQNEQAGEARYKLATAFEAAGDPRGAIREFIRAADLLPDNLEAQLKAATYLLLAGRFEDAQSRAQRVLDRHPQHVEAQILRANALAGLRDLDGAITQIEEAIALDPERAASYANLAKVKLAQGKRDEARTILEKAAELDASSVPARLALANFQWATGEHAKAEQNLQRVLENDPDQPLAHRALAVLYMTTNRASAAESHLRHVAERSPATGPRLALADYYLALNRPEDARTVLQPLVAVRQAYAGAQSRLAHLEYVAGRHARAHVMIDEALAREPKNVGVQMMKGRWLLAERKIDQARQHAGAAVQADPNAAGAHYLLGVIQATQLDHEAAGNSFREVLRLNPRAAVAQLALSEMELLRGRAAAAMELAEGVLQTIPGHPYARLTIVRALIDQRQLTRAETELRTLRADYPTVAAIRVTEGALLTAQGQLALARQSYEHALQLDATSIDGIKGLTTVDLAEKRIAAARARIDAQVAAHPERVDLLLLGSQVYVADRDVANAERVLRRAIEIAPLQIEGYTRLAGVYLVQGKLDAAKQEFDQLTRRDPKNVMAHTMSALIVHAQNNLAEAKRRYEDIVEIDGKAAVALNNLAWIYAEEKTDLDRALHLAERAAQLLPRSAEAQDTLGWVYFQKELPALAIAPFERSAQLAPENASYRYHLGLAYLKSGDRESARRAFEQALRLDPSSAQSREIQKSLASLQG